MKEVLQKIMLAGLLFSFLFSGCAATAPVSETDPDRIITADLTAGERIFFPLYNLSLNRPPSEWEMQRDPGEGELVIWLNREEGSVIEIMVSTAVKEQSYHDVAVEFTRVTCALVQLQSPAVNCVIVDERQMQFNRNRFYRVSIIYQGLFHDSSVKSQVYLHRTDRYVFHFIFMEGKSGLLADAMIQSVVIHDQRRQRAAVEEKAAPGSLIDAAYCGDTAAVETLLAAGIDVNAKDRDGVTPLAYAAAGGHKDIVEILLARNADANARSNIGSTPLMNAAFMGHVEIVELLVVGGADVNIQSLVGTTALMNAAAHGHKTIVNILLAHDADADACEQYGLNALWNAISSGYADIVQMLIDNGAEVNGRALDGTTALMNAAFTGNTAMVRMLLTAGAEVNARADNGWTALHVAKSRNCADIVRLLITAGAMEDSPRGPELDF